MHAFTFVFAMRLVAQTPTVPAITPRGHGSRRSRLPSVALSHGDYHQVTDEAQYIDYDDLARVARLVRDAALRIANLDQRPALDHPRGDPHAACVR